MGFTESVVRSLRLTDYRPSDTFREDIVRGLSAKTKITPPKHLYDQRGSVLFDRICELDAYYLTRTERGIMEDHADEMADALGEGVKLVELGAGSSLKTRTLLRSMRRTGEPAAYVPVDISREFLVDSAREIADEFDGLEVCPVCADFTEPFDAPDTGHDARSTAIYFPGSTIGNLFKETATDLLERCSVLGDRLLIGIDLIKDPETLELAYNDPEGITDEFNSNLFTRINRELGGTVDPDNFRYTARWNPRHERVEMDQVSQRDQSFLVDGHRIEMREGETIRTEQSHKYDLNRFCRWAGEAGFEAEPERVWADEGNKFAVVLLRSLNAN